MSKQDDKRVIVVMTQIYCSAHHSTEQRLCAECTDFVLYATERIDRCPLCSQKTSCRKCAIHCYNAKYRQQAKLIMRYAGVRMVFKHPLMAFRHLIREIG